ncbi:hypothetical protein BX661DRAFT_186570 [Kickxella alabastrina]|uniref:uncharacterized protein n=1 Tax=Kickxella alabastrina TaxID=61397 RepID=UPI002220DC74|nr:uncharacterized protein BX661DRAFT_186570 [Kickxella alabastrina]KAI7823424.1 hypothetical protein BX661DRAFT_186570 [Kickxella alabastrina]
MSTFHNDIFNRRSSNVFLNEFKQDKHPGIFAPAAIPKPLFCQNDGQAMRRSSFSGTDSHSSMQNQRHFAYVAGCEICDDYVRKGAEMCHHEHRIVCRGMGQGCGCHGCCHQRESAAVQQGNNGYRARTEESVSDSAFGNGRVRARSATTTVGDADFGFANMDSEMMRMKSTDNQWRQPSRNQAEQPFYARPLDCSAQVAPVPQGHVQLREGNVAQMFDAHGQMHNGMQAAMRADARSHFDGHARPQPMFGAAYGCSREEESKVKKTTTTTTTTTTTKLCDNHCTPCPPPPCPPQPCPPPVVVVPVPHQPLPPPTHHHHHVGPTIPVGTKPDGMVKRAEPCCTWCKFLPCLSCPKPTNPNERFKKKNFRLYPEYEFLPDDLEMPRPTEYFPEHTHFASRSEYKITIPKVAQAGQRVFVDFIGDQMIIIGERGKPLAHSGALGHLQSSGSSTRSTSFNSKEKAHMNHFVPVADHLPVGVSRVFVKNFFLPRDTYDRNRAQAFIKPNGKLKIVVPVLEA